MIRQAAFTGKTPLLKGALHCHTTRSDGKGTPEETLRLHKANGYDFVALTDHRNYNFKNFAPETGLIVVPGMEMDRSIPGQPGIHCFHTVVLGREKDKGNPYEQDQRFESGAYPARKNSSPCSMNTTATVRSRSTAIRNGAARPRGNSRRCAAISRWKSGTPAACWKTGWTPMRPGGTRS